MADVATLGLAVDSSQVKSATAALNQFNAASNTAAKGADKLAASGAKSESTMRAIEAAAKRSGISTAEMEKRVDAAAAARNKLNAASQSAVKGMETLSVSTRKVANDNQELGKQTDKTRGAMEVFATRLTRGLIAGVALQSVKTLIDYLVQLNGQLAATADTAQRVGVGGQQYQGLQSTASYKGIGNADFNAAMLAFGKNVDEARHGLGDLQSLLALNGRTVKDTAGTFGVVADLVRNAASESQNFNILQAAGLPVTQAFVRLMEQGADAIARQSLAAAKLQDKQLEDAKRLEDRWNEMWTNFANWGKGAILDVGEHIKNMPTPFAHQGTWLGRQLQNLGFDRPEDPNSPRNQGIDMLRRGMGSQLGQNGANSFYNATGGFGNVATPDPTKDLLVARQQIALEQQRLGLLSPLATAQDVVRAKQLEINAAALNNVSISKQQADALKLVTLAQFEMNRVNQQAQIGVFNLDAANKAARDTLKAWVAQKLLDPTNAEQMAAAQAVLAKNTQQLADAAKVAAAPLEGLQRLINEGGNLRGVLDNGVVSGLNSVENALVDITSGSVSAADGFNNLSQSVIRAIEQMIIKITIITPLAKALQAALGGFNLFGGGAGTGQSLSGTGGLFANGGVFPANDNGISRFSSQIVSKPTMFAFANGVGLMGEAGAEAIMPLQRGSDGKLGVRAAGAGGGAPVINIINQSSGQVEQGGVRQNQDGSFDVFIRDAVRGVISDDVGRGGPITKTMKAVARGNNGS